MTVLVVCCVRYNQRSVSIIAYGQCAFMQLDNKYMWPMESAIFILYFWFRILFQSSSSEFYDFIHIKKWRFNGWSEGFWVLFLDKYPRQGKGILINFGSESTQLDTGSLLCVCDTCEWSSLKIIVRAIKQWLIVVINQNVRENSSSAGSVATADINNNQSKQKNNADMLFVW